MYKWATSSTTEFGWVRMIEKDRKPFLARLILNGKNVSLYVCDIVAGTREFISDISNERTQAIANSLLHHLGYK